MKGKFILGLVIAGLILLLGIIIATTLAQLDVANNVTDTKAQINGIAYAAVLASFLLIPLMILQFARKPKMQAYGIIACWGIVFGTFGYQFLGITGVYYQLLVPEIGKLIIFTGIALCFGSCLYGLIGHHFHRLNFA